MSIAAMSWAWRSTLPPSSRLILLALADEANDVGECWPGIKRIATKCGISERTVQRVIKYFERDGLLIITRRYRHDGSQSSNLYKINMATPSVNMAPGGEDISCRGRQNVTVDRRHCHRVDAIDVSPHEPSTESLIETTTTNCPSRAKAIPRVDLVVPKRLPDGDRQGIVAQVREIPPDDAQMLLDELDWALGKPGTIKTLPGMWFYGVVQRYKRGEFIPVGAHIIAARREKPRAPAKVDRVSVDPAVARKYMMEIAAKLHTNFPGAE